MPCNVELSGIESYLFTVMSRECIMRTYVNQVKKNYDYILIDCTPSLGLLPINAFVAADSIIVPSQPRILSTKGLDLLLRTYSQVKRGINPDLKIDGILFTMVDAQTVNDRSVIESMHVVSSNKDSKTEKIIIETRDDSGNIIETESTVTKTYLYITVTHKTPDAMAAQYGFTDEQKAWLAELLSEDNKKLWNSILY